MKLFIVIMFSVLLLGCFKEAISERKFEREGVVEEFKYGLYENVSYTLNDKKLSFRISEPCKKEEKPLLVGDTVTVVERVVKYDDGSEKIFYSVAEDSFCLPADKLAIYNSDSGLRAGGYKITPSGTGGLPLGGGLGVGI